MKFETFRTALLIVVIILLGIWGYNSISGGRSSQETATTQQPGNYSNQTNSAFTFHSYDEVKTFMNNEVEKPLPGEFKIPEYISSGQELDDVYKVFAKRYPEFYGFHGTQLMDSVWRHPVRYIDMITENKAIRRYYDPNSNY